MKKGFVSYLIEVLTSNDFYGSTDTIEFAKGSQYLPTKIGDLKKQIKRTWRRK